MKVIDCATCLERLKNENIVFIADRVFKSINEIDAESATLEMISDEYYYDVFDCLNSISKSVIHYNTLPNFIDNISKHKNDIVFTIYGGSSSRNRMALVSAICEAYNIRFVGADAYARIICQDKQISKEHSKRLGLRTPNYLLADQFTDLELSNNLILPIVVKPNLEGSSIGIHEKSLLNSYEEVKALAQEMLNKYQQPILIEEFIPGKEVCVCISGPCNDTHLMEAVEVFMSEDESFFNQNLYTASIKHHPISKIKHRIITDQLNEGDLKSLKNIFLSLGKLDYLRIDGKLYYDKFYLLELTPDPNLSRGSSFALAFKQNGLSYEEMISTFICNSLKYYQRQYSSR